MSTAVETTSRGSFPARVVTFYHDVMVEMRKVTWPDWPQVRQATIGIIVVVLFIGAVIGLIDLICQSVLVTGLPRLFAR
ncbi:MAG: preprotein translocase subunit SecE [Gemmatimonadota bacterium]